MNNAKAIGNRLATAVIAAFILSASCAVDESNKNGGPSNDGKVVSVDPPTEWKNFYYEDGRLKQRYEYYLDSSKKVIMHGKSESYYPSGRMSVERTYRNDNPNGPWIHYDELGRKDMEWNYKDGNLHGLSRDWWPNGQLRAERMYHDDKKHGAYTTYHDNGQVEERAQYRNGEMVGKCERFKFSGDKSWIMTFDDKGTPIGVHEWWGPGDNLVRRIDYTAKDGLVEINEWFTNGAKWSHGKLQGGATPHGTWTYWNMNGDVVAEGEWKNGQPWSGVCRVTRFPTDWTDWIVGPSSDFFRMKDGKQIEKVDVRFYPE